MSLQQLFKKDITRPIDGVIKAADEEHLTTEVEEYVITEEVKRLLEQQFLDIYTNANANTNGAWISGFFGSGKSHLLKMLSLLLENKTLSNGRDVKGYFAEKTENGTLFAADLNKAAGIPSKSILFNIDAKADVVSKDDADAVLGVFMKVFNEMQGYYGKHGWLAELERAMDLEGIFGEFQGKFLEINGKTWDDRRNNLLMAKKEFAKAYVAVRGGSEEDAQLLLKESRATYTLSIEDFANRVAAYIEDQDDPRFRLNFFVDEVGQYISDNVKLMTNLQTIAESLFTACKGRAWVFVTSQENMDNLVDGLRDRQSNDFSKIQARFGCKLNLGSQNVREVIQKRLLDKDGARTQVLSELWKEHGANFPTLFRFHEGGSDYPVIEEEQSFIDLYPFQNYHFELLQDCIRELSTHGAFQGKHTSVGARSNLSVFQEVVKDMIREEMEVGALPTFDRMYDGLKPIMRQEIRASVSKAEGHYGATDLRTRLLKALFMVKYVESFKSTPKHLAILLLDRLDADPKAHEQAIKTALNQLEHNIYVQRNGDQYEFLTSIEKDVENKIKGTTVDASRVRSQLLSWMFDDVVEVEIVTEERTKQRFKFNRLLDGAPLKRADNELSLHIVTERNESYAHPDHANLIAQTSGTTELRFILPPNPEVFADVKLYLQTETYCARAAGTAPAEQTPIIMARRLENSRRKPVIIRQLNKLLSQAVPIANGSELKHVSGTTPPNRVTNALQELLVITYPNLKMLGANVKESDLETFLTQPASQLAQEMQGGLGPAEEEVLNYVTLQTKHHARPTARSIADHFEKRPYGWDKTSALTVVGRLVGGQRLELLLDHEERDEPREILAILKNRDKAAAAYLRPVSKVDNKQVKQLRDLHQELFHHANPGAEAKEVARAFQAALKKERDEVKSYLERTSEYPFLKALLPYAEKLSAHLDAKPLVYFDKITQLEDDLLDFREDHYSKIKEFLSGEMSEIYRSVRQFVDFGEENHRHVEPELMAPLRNLLTHQTPYLGPAVREGKAQLATAKQAVEELLDREKDQATKLVEAELERLQQNEMYAHLTETEKQNQADSVAGFIREFQAQRKVSHLRERLRRFESDDSLRLLNSMARLTYDRINPPAPPSTASSPTSSTPPITIGGAPQKTHVSPSRSEEPKPNYRPAPSIKAVSVAYGNYLIENEADLDQFLAEYRAAVTKILNSGHGVHLRASNDK
ncbi:BREX system P-loop protein BrxC [Neolewinella antarctica]|uniref:BREX system P-loop protein BrxC n=1 Tax=Neolewinella antarctica TaxID=442734 RepID=A0ABX0XGN6_9BACT|nr:BREX system P-loop protein BrxC [Neolewinella antarctica]NJC28496.1 hypothetical protein [Neolewinella antarctica]